MKNTWKLRCFQAKVTTFESSWVLADNNINTSAVLEISIDMIFLSKEVRFS